MNEQIARYQEIERRGLLDRLPPEKQAAWAEVKRRGLDKAQPEQPAQDNYSALDKAKYVGRAAGEGLTFGLGDIVGGITNTVATPIGKTVNALTSDAPLSLSDFNPWTNFKQGRKDFVREQNAFAEEHPYLNFAGELGGGLVTGIAGAGKNLATAAGKQGLKSLMNESARQGAKFGMLYGAGSGLTQDVNKISVPNALIGAGTGLAGGAAIGAAIPPVVAVAGKVAGPVVDAGKSVVNVLRNMFKKGNQTVGNAGYVSTSATPENKVFLNLLEANPEGTMEAAKRGEPLIAHANRKQLRRARGAVTADEGADQAFIESKNAFDEAKIQKGEDLTDRLLSKESGYTATDRIAADARAKYQPLYEEVMKAGEIPLTREMITNDTILGAIKEAQKRAGYTKLKANDVRVLDKAKRVLQDKFTSLKKAGKLDEAREYQLAKDELVTFMDAQLEKYPQARQAFMEGKDLEEFVSLGRKLKTLPHAEVEQISRSLNNEQKQALKAGLGDSVRESIYNTNNMGSDVLNKAFPLQLRRKMKVLGIDDAELVKEINKEIQTNRNYQFIAGGSNTMNKAADSEQFGLLGQIARAIRVAKSPIKSLTIAADKADNAIQGLNAQEVTRLMFDPKALAKEAQRPEHQRKIMDILRKASDKNPNIAKNPSIAQILSGKLKEKGGYAMKDLGTDKYGVRRVLLDNAEFNNAKRPDRGTSTFGLYDTLGHSGRAEAAYADGLVDEFEVMNEIKRLFPEATDKQAEKIKQLAYSEWHHSDKAPDIMGIGDKTLKFYDLTGRKFFDENGNFIDPIKYANNEISKDNANALSRKAMDEYRKKLETENPYQPLKNDMQFPEEPNDFVADVSFPIWGNRGKFIGNENLKGVKVEKNGSTYKIYGKDGKLLYSKRESPNLKISNKKFSNKYQQSVANFNQKNDEVRTHLAKDFVSRLSKSPKIKSFFDELVSKGYEVSKSGNFYIKNTKPQSATIQDGTLRLIPKHKDFGNDQSLFEGFVLQKGKNGKWENIEEVTTYPNTDIWSSASILHKEKK